jgi:hypothetical protein
MNSPENSSPNGRPEFAVVVACNDDEVLQSNLMRSPEIGSIQEVIVRRGFRSASEAYNSGIDASEADVIVFAHQDVYLPDGWFRSLSASIKNIEAKDPSWGVIGLFGIAVNGGHAGYVYSCGLQRVLGKPATEPVEVGSLDELVLIVRRSSGLRFDHKLPGFHLYGTDICLEAHRRRLKCYGVSNFCIHNSNGLNKLPGAFIGAVNFLKNKWREQLPIRTPCMVITRSGIPMLRHRLESFFRRNKKSGRRCADPSALYRQLLAEKRVEPDVATVLQSRVSCP